MIIVEGHNIDPPLPMMVWQSLSWIIGILLKNLLQRTM